MGWTIGVLGFDSRRGLGILLSTAASRTAAGPTQPPIQRVPGALSLGIKRPGVKLTIHQHLIPRSTNEWSYTSTPQYAFMALCSVKKSTGTTLPLPFWPLLTQSQVTVQAVQRQWSVDITIIAAEFWVAAEWSWNYYGNLEEVYSHMRHNAASLFHCYTNVMSRHQNAGQNHNLKTL
jgi:hypothetical protein